MRRSLGAAVTLVGVSSLQVLTGGHSVFAQEFDGREKLRAHSQEFRKEVVKVTDGVDRVAPDASFASKTIALASADNQFPHPYPAQNGSRAVRLAIGVRF